MGVLDLIHDTPQQWNDIGMVEAGVNDNLTFDELMPIAQHAALQWYLDNPFPR